MRYSVTTGESSEILNADPAPQFQTHVILTNNAKLQRAIFTRPQLYNVGSANRAATHTEILMFDTNDAGTIHEDNLILAAMMERSNQQTLDINFARGLHSIICQSGLTIRFQGMETTPVGAPISWIVYYL